jgi:hypothetical protein
LQSLTDLENSRDDLLYELHKLPNQAPADKVMLKAYFEDVEVLSQLLEKQLRLVLSRTLNTVRKEPTVIVTALRIIEREEKADAFALQVWSIGSPFWFLTGMFEDEHYSLTLQFLTHVIILKLAVLVLMYTATKTEWIPPSGTAQEMA